ncbi:MAG: amino acid ABC transporter substrate-binding protein [Reyranella sp.]|nr:amino acid ABC transporter substrate-binding protein [Reyranella sp.]
MRNAILAGVIGLAVATQILPGEAGSILDAVKARGQLICGVPGQSIGFASEVNGKYVGLDVDVCRAAAVALLGDAGKVKFVPLAADKRFPALKAGEVDLLVSNSTLTLTRASEAGFEFLAVYFYDGQGIMVPRKLGKRSIKDLNGVSICVAGGTTTERNLGNHFQANKQTYKPVVLQKVEDVRTTFFDGKCDAYTADAATLYAARAAYAPIPQEYMVLPELISKEPLAQIVRDGDAAFARIVSWSFFTMVEAEEKKISSKTSMKC